MVFYLDDKLINDGPSQDGFYDFLHNLMLAYREGKHLIVIEPKNVKKLLRDKKLDSYTLQSLQDYDARNKAALSYLNYFSIIIQIISCSESESIDIDTQSSIEFRKIRFTRFLDSASIQQSILLGENGNDAQVYKLFAEYFMHHKKLNAFKVVCKTQSGGGDPTVDEYTNIYRQTEEFCLCILDSDRRKPCKDYGATARKVKVFHDTEVKTNPNFKCHYQILDCLEIENLFPREFYEETYQDYNHRIIHQQLRTLEQVDRNAKLYFDLKDGLKAFCKQADEALNHYWFRVIYQTSIRCVDYDDKTMYINGYGSNILRDFLNYDKTKVFAHINLNPQLQDLWLKLGKLICSFILGLEKKRL